MAQLSSLGVLSMSKRLYFIFWCMCFAAFCVSSAMLTMKTFKRLNTDEGFVFDPFQRDAAGHYSVWIYPTVAFLLCTVVLTWRLVKFSQKT